MTGDQPRQQTLALYQSAQHRLDDFIVGANGAARAALDDWIERRIWFIGLWGGGCSR